MKAHDAWLHAPGTRERRESRCTERGRSWDVIGHAEYGLWYPERDDVLCEECGAKGKL
jgi:hypothetical protein